MGLDLSQLNDRQRSAVEDFEGPTMILAGAGTGKTKVVTYRMAHMIRSGRLAESIVALTFTNKAAREMKERLATLVPDVLSRRVFTGTFHRFALLLLRQYGVKVGLLPGFRLLSTGDQLELVERSLLELNLKSGVAPSTGLAAISMCKNRLLDPSDLRLRPELCVHDGIPLARLADLYENYTRQLRLCRGLDFDDCIFLAVKVLRDDAVRAQVLKRLAYLLVDEFQDTNEAQLELMRLLVGPGENVCVVGDDDQSIYSWRGAVPSIMEGLFKIYPRMKLVKLEQNYRCGDQILLAANSVIACNEQRIGKTLWTEHCDREPVSLIDHESESDEVEWVGHTCLGWLGQGLRPREIAVLYRANNLSRDVEIRLRELGIPVRVFGGQSFFDQREVKDFMAYVRLVLDDEDRLAFFRIANVPNRRLGVTTLERVDRLSSDEARSPLAILREGRVSLDARQVEHVRTFLGQIDELRKLPLDQPEDLRRLGERIVHSMQLMDVVTDRYKSPQKTARRQHDVKTMPRVLEEMAQAVMAEEGRLALDVLLDHVTLAPEDPEQSRKVRDHGDYVSLMTVHAAKGLEFRAVIVIALEEGIFPHRQAVEEGGLAEERRLFYVAITRARERLFLSRAGRRASVGRTAGSHHSFMATRAQRPSRFLNEVPQEACVRRSPGPDDASDTPEDPKDRLRGRLSKLRQALGTTP